MLASFLLPHDALCLCRPVGPIYLFIFFSECLILAAINHIGVQERYDDLKAENCTAS